MRHCTVPYVGHWYQDREYHSAFNVVALDDSGQNVEIQYFSGEIEEVDIDSWYERSLESIAPPEDWSGPFELSAEDLDNYSGSFNPQDESDFLNTLESEEL